MTTPFTSFAQRRVLITGHTGFKGSWLALALQRQGARVFGLSLPAPTEPSHYAALELPGRFPERESHDLDFTGAVP